MSSDLLRRLVKLSFAEREQELRRLSPVEREQIRHHWRLWARPEQLPPPSPWSTWVICAGRGFGKTRSGAEWVRHYVKGRPEARLALVGANLAEARSVMVEGESGILAVAPPDRTPLFEPSLRRLVWPNGAQAFLYSAAEPESLRGAQHHAAWCDELGKWEQASDRAARAWDNLAMGLRLGENPQALVTTTPRSTALMRRLLAREGEAGMAVTRGTMRDNGLNLAAGFRADMERRYGGTALGRQELDGELLEEVEGALWSRATIERARVEALALLGDPAVRVVVGVDPPASARGDACGIVVCALTTSGTAVVLADRSAEKASPERWARAVADAAQEWNADRVVAEANQGGEMVRSVLRAADVTLPVKLVHASRGKAARAEPVAALYEADKVRHAGMFARLEDELCGIMAGGGYAGPGRSPDRADALVWALSELMLGKRGCEPRVRVV